jgi:uncharacterized membrane protein
MDNLHERMRIFFMAAGIAGVILILALIGIIPFAIRTALAVPLILFLPGYGLTAVLFPRRALDLPARLLLSVGLSLAMTAFSGLILHLTPRGIQLQNPWTLLLLGGTGLAGLYFLIRDARHVDWTATRARIGLTSRQILLLLSAAVIAALAVNIARTPASPKDLEGYTLLWVQASDSPDQIKLGVRSEEFETTKYQLRFEMNEILREGLSFELEPGQTREYSLKLNGEDLTGQPVTVLLYRLDKPNEVYRRVVWWYENN